MLVDMDLFLLVASRDFHLAHSGFLTTVGSWVAVEPNGMGLPSTGKSPRGLGAMLPSPPRALKTDSNMQQHLYAIVRFLYYICRFESHCRLFRRCVLDTASKYTWGLRRTRELLAPWLSPQLPFEFL